MSAKYFELSLDPNGALQANPVQQGRIPTEARRLHRQFSDLFDKIRTRTPASPKRTAYANTVLSEAKNALEAGNLDAGKNFIANFDEDALNIRYYKAHIDANFDLRLAPVQWLEDPTPPGVQTLVSRLENAISKVRLLVPEGARREVLMRTLESHARHGFETGKLADATTALSSFEARFVAEEGPPIRKRHLEKTLSTAAWIIASAFAFLLFALKFFPVLPEWLGPIVPPKDVVATVALLAIGMSLGIVFFTFVRNLAMTFDTLGNFDPAQLSPWLRFTLVSVIVAILCILMSSGLIKLEINDLALHEYMKNGYAAVIVGLVCGYSDAAITKLLTGVLERK